MSSNRRLAINLVANIMAFVVNFLISFFLTPYIIENVGKEAYGFVSLGNNFINYAFLITIALNSMAGRFVTIKLHEGDTISANRYFSSVFIANVFMVFILVLPMTLIVLYIQNLVNVPENIVGDVKLLLTLLFINFLLGIVSSVFSIATFAKNRVDLSAKRNIESNFIKLAILLIMFGVFSPSIWYLGFATLICNIYIIIMNIRYTKILIPEIKIKRKYFNIIYIKELVKSGIWNTIARVGSIALTELDLLLSNIFISASAMGTLSIVKTIPNYVVSLTSTIVSVFMPDLTIAYAKNKNNPNKLVKIIRNNIKIVLFFESIAYPLLIAYSDLFFKLWLPKGNYDIEYMYLLSIISISGCFISAVMNVLFNVFTVTNKIKVSSIVVIITGIVSLMITYLFLKYTNLGLLAITGVSVILCFLKNIAINIPYAAKCLNVKRTIFFKDLALNFVDMFIAIGIAFFFKSFIKADTWIKLLILCSISASIIIIINYFVLLGKEERKFIMNKIRRKK